MASNVTRGMNANLAEGMSDGTYKKVVRDRGGIIDEATFESRSLLDDVNFGIHEAKVKILGDGTHTVTPDYVTTPDPNALRW